MVGKRFAANDLLPYVAAQVAGGPGFSLAGGLDHSPGKYTMMAGLVTEVVLTFMFLMIILGSTDKRVPAGFAPIAIGWSLTLIHPVGIPVTNCL